MNSAIMSIIFFSLFLPGSQDNFRAKREEMVRSQIVARGISSSRVIDAMQKVPRHRFVPNDYLLFAYSDQPLPIGEGQTISQPYVVAYMTESLDIQPGDKVLEIGTGSGYQAAVLAEMKTEVYSIELIGSLSENAGKILTELGYPEVHLKTGDGYQGWPEFAPFDAIIVTCSPGKIPAPLQQQLAEGGKMIIPVGELNSIQYLYLLEKVKGKIIQKNVMPVRFVPMLDGKGNIY